MQGTGADIKIKICNKLSTTAKKTVREGLGTRLSMSSLISTEK